MAKTSDTPIAGSVVQTEWIDNGTVIATVEKDGEIWYETYTFESAEKGE